MYVLLFFLHLYRVDKRWMPLPHRYHSEPLPNLFRRNGCVIRNTSHRPFLLPRGISLPILRVHARECRCHVFAILE